MAPKKTRPPRSASELKPPPRASFGRKKFKISVLTILIAIALHFLTSYVTQSVDTYLAKKAKLSENPRTLRYTGMVLYQWNPNGNLRTMDRVFDRLGYVKVDALEGDDWDVFWPIENPFNPIRKSMYKIVTKPLKPHQRICHFPSINHITSKVYLSSCSYNRKVPYILQGFHFPQQLELFKKFVEENPKTRFIEKDVENKGIKLVEMNEIKMHGRSNKYYQVFMENPVLIDGHAMDLAVYVMITSLDPIRIYRFDDEIHLRLCNETYYPFDAKNLHKYVVSDTRKTTEHMPSLKKYFEVYGFSCKHSIEQYLIERGHNISELWRKIDDAITTVITNNEAGILRETLQMYKSTENFFEMVRFDFLVNQDLHPFISEVNLSPGITPSHNATEIFASTYEQVIFNTVKLAGLGSYNDLMANYDDSESNEMLSNVKNIAVDPASCAENNCGETCESDGCELCSSCLSKTSMRTLHRAYRENINRGGYKRVFPSVVHFNDSLISKMTLNNQLSARWFREKCRENSDWC